MDRITSADVMGVLMLIWSTKHTTAKRVRERIGTVMKWAIAQGYRVDNPAGAGDPGRGEGARAPVGESFPSARGLELQALRLSELFRELGIPTVPHGFRSSFRDWAAERTEAPHAVMAAARAHVVRNQVEAACARSDPFERRRVLMEQWAAYLAGRGASTETLSNRI